MSVRKRLSNSTICSATNFDYKRTYQNLAQDKHILSLSDTQKGHITCRLKQPEVFVEISSKGNVIIYYHQYRDRNEAIRILKKLVVCDCFSIVQDVPRTLQSIQEGIEASLDLINPELLQRLDFDNYILQTASPKTYEAVAEGICNYLTKLLERYEYSRAIEVMENTAEWVVTFGMTVTEEILPSLDYVETCDRLKKELTSALEESPYEFRICEDDRDGEGLSLRYTFVWRPADGPLELPQFPYAEYWERLELAPFEDIYPDSDFNDL
jgi:hypothetical protein